MRNHHSLIFSVVLSSLAFIYSCGGNDIDLEKSKMYLINNSWINATCEGRSYIVFNDGASENPNEGTGTMYLNECLSGTCTDEISFNYRLNESGNLYIDMSNGVDSDCAGSDRYDGLVHYAEDEDGSYAVIQEGSNTLYILGFSFQKSSGSSGGADCDIANYDGPEFNIQVDSQCKTAFLYDCDGNNEGRDAACKLYYEYESSWQGSGSFPECPYCP